MDKKYKLDLEMEFCMVIWWFVIFTPLSAWAKLQGETFCTLKNSWNWVRGRSYGSLCESSCRHEWQDHVKKQGDVSPFGHILLLCLACYVTALSSLKCSCLFIESHDLNQVKWCVSFHITGLFLIPVPAVTHYSILSHPALLTVKNTTFQY